MCKGLCKASDLEATSPAFPKSVKGNSTFGPSHSFPINSTYPAIQSWSPSPRGKKAILEVGSGFSSGCRPTTSPSSPLAFHLPWPSTLTTLVARPYGIHGGRAGNSREMLSEVPTLWSRWESHLPAAPGSYIPHGEVLFQRLMGAVVPSRLADSQEAPTECLPWGTVWTWMSLPGQHQGPQSLTAVCWE